MASIESPVAELGSGTENRLRSLIAIAQSLMTTADPDEVLTVILDSATRMFAVDGCSLALADEATRELVFFAMEGRAKTEPFRVPLGQGIAGHVMQTGEPVRSNDVAHDQRFYRGIDRNTGFQTRSLLCTPVQQRGRTIGVMQALNTHREGGFTDEDQALLAALAGMAGAALMRARSDTAVRNAGEAMRTESDARYRLVPSRDPAMKAAVEVLRTAAQSPVTVLLLGETGTGKEVAARSVHNWSARATRPFVAINCVALSPTLLESELFGHEKGAFTGASARKQGKFELADTGTLFLDEIGELSPDLQTKLLRVLQEREFQRVGGNATIRTDVRLLAATNRELKVEIAAGRFREDLYYRLNVVSVKLPPLRNRPSDVAVLAEHFLRRSCEEMKRPRLELAPETLAILTGYRWPGNVRELANVLERAVVLCAGPVVQPDDLPVELRQTVEEAPIPLVAAGGGESPAQPATLDQALLALKQRMVREALAACAGNQSRAAARLGLHQANLSRLMKNLGMR